MSQLILLYLLKANAVLALFTATYYGLLRKLTFFELNRAYLLLAVLFAAVYPALPVPALLPAEVVQVLSADALAAPATAAPALASAATGPALDWPLLLLGTYAAGTALLLLRLLAQLLSLALLRRRARPTHLLGVPVRVLAGGGGPFSFHQTIYLSEDTLTHATDLAAALRHEQAHVQQHHTLDVLMLQLATALAWLNPAAWLLRRAALDNLEYLADRAALRTGLDCRLYQYSLLRQQPGGVPAPALAFHFSFLSLKNRIAMLNQPISPTRQLGRYLLAAPLAMLLALGYSAARAQAAPAKPLTLTHPETHQDRSTRKPLIYIDGQRRDSTALQNLNPDDVASMTVLKPDNAYLIASDAAGRGMLLIITKAGEKDPAVRALNQQLGISNDYTQEPGMFSEIRPKALAYITSHYPDSRLIDVSRFTRKNTGAVKYRVQIATGRRPQYVYFDAEGNVQPGL